VLERAALHQTRFRTPGVAPDARGVVLGQKGLVLFPSLDRLVAFLRAYGDEGSLDELLPTLTLRRLVTPLKTRELMLSVQAESSYRMDRIAGVAKLAGGLVFTGTQRHFAKYRDSASPLGYDVQELLDQPADLVLYHDTFRQAYQFDRDLQFRDLVFKLTPYRQPTGLAGPDGAIPQRLWATAEVGVGGAILSYLFRWQIPARAALAEWPSQSAFDDRPRRLYVFDISETPERVALLFASLPGVHVFEPLGQSFAAEASRISLAFTLAGVQMGCAGDPSGASTANNYHPQVASQYQAMGCTLTDQAVEAYGRGCSSGQRPCSEVAVIAGTPDEQRATALGLDAGRCYAYTSGQGKVIGCTTDQGFKLIHLENVNAVQ